MGKVKKLIYFTFSFFFLLLALHFKTAPISDRFKFGCIYHNVCDKALYFGAGFSFGTCAVSSRIMWSLLYNSTSRQDLSTFSELCTFASFRCFQHAAQNPPSWIEASNGSWIPKSHKSWHENHAMLQQIPCLSDEGAKLLTFLDKRWLAKANGFFPLEVNYVSPCFGLEIQVSPETRNSYARDPFSQASQVYENRVAAWKEKLSDLKTYPLLLTRSGCFEKYLPSFVTSLDTLKSGEKHILDLTGLSTSWEEYRRSLKQECAQKKIDIDNLLCIKCIKEKEGSAICLLPLNVDRIEEDTNFLLSWISVFGITANPIELDRMGSPSFQMKEGVAHSAIDLKEIAKQIENIRSIDIPHERKIIVEGFLKNFEAFLPNIRVFHCPTKMTMIQKSLSNIAKELSFLEKPNLSFLDLTSHIERAHLNLLSLLEITSPFDFDDFSNAYAKIINPPKSLKPLTTYGLLTTGMNAIAGIYKALGENQNTICGQNTYFECVHAANRVSNTLMESDATDKDFEEADLLIAQFNPVLRRDNRQNETYSIEKVAKNLKRALTKTREKKLVLALDLTIEYLDSSRLRELLNEFEEEIRKGSLCVIGFRSGLKFDLFGMDNYAGAPCFIIHNQDLKWHLFDNILEDKALQTDRLSLQWFTLAFENTSDLLDLYRKQIFENTKAVLKALPDTCYQKNRNVRVIASDDDVDLSFIDIKVTGPLHIAKVTSVVGLSLYLHCMKEKQPIFLRRSFGFYHTNFGMLFTPDESTIRLTVGLDPTHVKGIAQCLQSLSTD